MAENSELTYQDGLRDGQLRALEEIVHGHRSRLDDHSRRIRILEKISWVLVGAIGLIQFGPAIRVWLGG